MAYRVWYLAAMHWPWKVGRQRDTSSDGGGNVCMCNLTCAARQVTFETVRASGTMAADARRGVAPNEYPALLQEGIAKNEELSVCVVGWQWLFSANTLKTKTSCCL